MLLLFPIYVPIKILHYKNNLRRKLKAKKREINHTLKSMTHIHRLHPKRPTITPLSPKSPATALYYYPSRPRLYYALNIYTRPNHYGEIQFERARALIKAPACAIHMEIASKLPAAVKTCASRIWMTNVCIHITYQRRRPTGAWGSAAAAAAPSRRCTARRWGCGPRGRASCWHDRPGPSVPLALSGRDSRTSRRATRCARTTGCGCWARAGSSSGSRGGLC